MAEQDDELLEKYLSGEELTIEEIKACIRKATINNDMVPVVCGTSYKNKGVQKLLDAIVDYLPAPTDVESIRGINPDTQEEEVRHSSDNEPFSALAFKIATDPYVGRLCFFRVYSGSVTSGSTVYNSTKGKNERMGRILQMHSNHRQDIEVCYAGDIAAVVGVKFTTTGYTLCDERLPIMLESIEFPEPVIRVAIEPKTKAGQRKWASRCRSSLRKTRLSNTTPTPKQVRQSSLAWASFILRLLSTVCCASSRSRPMLADPRSHTEKQSPKKLFRYQVCKADRRSRSVRPC